MSAKYSTRSPPQDRHHAVAVLDGLIVEAERVRDRYSRCIERLEGANSRDRRFEVLLRIAQYHLTQLHRSLDVLVHGDAGDNGPTIRRGRRRGDGISAVAGSI